MKSEERILRRYEHIDILRIVGCIMVIFNHTCERGFYRYVSEQVNTATWVINLIASIACKSAVPIFFMISGALLIKKSESVKKTFLRIPKIVFDLIFFSILYYAIDTYVAGIKLDFQTIILGIVQTPYWHLWYLYAYIALILTLPFFRDFVQSLKRTNLIVLYIQVVIILGLLPIIEYFVIGIYGSLKPKWITENVFIFPLMGFIIENKIDIKSIKGKWICLAWLGNACCFIISTISEYYFLQREPGNTDETFLRLFCCINAPIIYLTVKWIVYKMKELHYQKIVCEIRKCTFGIYLLHIIFLWKIQPLYRFWINFFESGEIGRKIGVYFSCASVFILAGVATYFLRKLPLIKRMF